MNIVLFGQDQALKAMAENLVNVTVYIAENENELNDLLEQQERYILLIDCDFDKGKAEEVNRKLAGNNSIHRIMVGRDFDPKELRKHQLSENAADGYIRKPLSVEILQAIVNDFELADHIQEKGIIKEGTDLGNPELTFIGINRDELLDQLNEQETVTDDEEKTVVMEVPITESNDIDTNQLQSYEEPAMAQQNDDHSDEGPKFSLPEEDNASSTMAFDLESDTADEMVLEGAASEEDDGIEIERTSATAQTDVSADIEFSEQEPTTSSTNSDFTGPMGSNEMNLDDDDDELSFNIDEGNGNQSINESNGDLAFDISLSDESEDEATSATIVASSHEEKAEDKSTATTIPGETKATVVMAEEGEEADLRFENTGSQQIERELTERPRESSSQLKDLFREDDLIKEKATIRQLREERDELLEQIKDLKAANQLLEQDNLGLKAEVEELQIEVEIVKKRQKSELEEALYQLSVSEEKKDIAEKKAKNIEKEFERLQQKIHIDLNHVKRREKELENQLEMVTMDSESQVKSRESKILDLKRKIDALEFNIENASIREQKSREDKVKLEEKLSKIMNTLRGSIKLLEEDLNLDEELLDKLDKL